MKTEKTIQVKYKGKTKLVKVTGYEIKAPQIHPTIKRALAPWAWTV